MHIFNWNCHSLNTITVPSESAGPASEGEQLLFSWLFYLFYETEIGIKIFFKKTNISVEKWDSKALIFIIKVFIKEKKKEKYGNNIVYIKNSDYSDEFEVKIKNNNESDSRAKK